MSATEDIIGEFRATGMRIHCLGIGAASQDRFLTLLARETGGTSRFLTPRERVDMGALELFASMGRPVASQVKVNLERLSGGHAVVEPHDIVFQDHPLVIMAEADSLDDGLLEVSWGEETPRRQFQVRANVGQKSDAELVRLLQGARLITDLESRLAMEMDQVGVASDKRTSREQSRAVKKLEQLSQFYGLASRAMALVAVVERKGDDLTQIPHTIIVPVGLPPEVSFDRVFPVVLLDAGVAYKRGERRRYVNRMRLPDCKSAGPTLEDCLVKSAMELLPDGGLPGKGDEDRWFKSLLLLICMLACGHTSKSGAFRIHVQKLVGYLKNVTLESDLAGDRELTEKIVAYAESDERLPEVCGRSAQFLLELNIQANPEYWCQLSEAVSGFC